MRPDGADAQATFEEEGEEEVQDREEFNKTVTLKEALHSASTLDAFLVLPGYIVCT